MFSRPRTNKHRHLPNLGRMSKGNMSSFYAGNICDAGMGDHSKLGLLMVGLIEGTDQVRRGNLLISGIGKRRAECTNVDSSLQRKALCGRDLLARLGCKL